MKDNLKSIIALVRKYRGLIFLILATLLLCYGSLHYFILNEHKAFQASGPIGDAFAGLTTPIINLLSVILIYLSFRQQFEANKIQKDALEIEIKRSNTLKELGQTIDLIRDVKGEIEDLEIINTTELVGDDIKDIYGVATLSYYRALNGEHELRKFIGQLLQPISLLSFICDKTESYKFHIRDERVIYEKICLLFSNNLNDGLVEFLKGTNKSYQSNVIIHVDRASLMKYQDRIRKYQSSFKKRWDEYVQANPTEAGITKGMDVQIVFNDVFEKE